jgi:hypothetical protein
MHDIYCHVHGGSKLGTKVRKWFRNLFEAGVAEKQTKSNIKIVSMTNSFEGMIKVK